MSFGRKLTQSLHPSPPTVASHVPSADGTATHFTRSSERFPQLISIISALSRLSSSQLALFQKPVSARHCLRLAASTSGSGRKEGALRVSLVHWWQHLLLQRCPAAAVEPKRWMEVNPVGKYCTVAQWKIWKSVSAHTGWWGGVSGISPYGFLCSLVYKSHSEQVVLGSLSTQPV